MSARTNRIVTIFIALALAAYVGWAVVAQMPVLLPIIGIVVALLLMRLVRRFTREIMIDERILKINEKASAISFRISTLLMAALSLVFIALKNPLPPEYEIVGSTLAYAACAVMLIHLAFYYYYKSKL